MMVVEGDVWKRSSICAFQQPGNVRMTRVPCCNPTWDSAEQLPVLKSVLAGGVGLNPFGVIELFCYHKAPRHGPKEWGGTGAQRVLQFFHPF